MSKESIKQILLDAKAIHKSFCKCIELASDSTTIRIESANYAYTIVSFCGRQMSDDNVENLSMEMFSMIEELKPNFMEFAIENYNKALSMTNKKANDGTLNHKDSNEHDERWLIFMMKGKILEKQKKPIVESLESYLKAVDNLIVQGATVPKKINFNSPPDWALELLEVYYRMHASVLKLELKDEEFPPPMKTLKDIWDKVKKVDDVIRVALSIDSGGGGKSSHSNAVNPSAASEDEPPAKVPKLMGDDQTALDDTAEVEKMWSKIADMCIKALELIIQRFPNHFKAVQ